MADTLHIDTDRAVATVVWRGRTALRHAAEAGRIIVSAIGTGAGAVAATATATGAGTVAASPTAAGVAIAAGALPLQDTAGVQPAAATVAALEGSLDEDAGTVIAPRDAGRARALPFDAGTDPDAGTVVLRPHAGRRCRSRRRRARGRSPRRCRSRSWTCPDPEDTGTLPGPVRPAEPPLPFHRKLAPPAGADGSGAAAPGGGAAGAAAEIGPPRADAGRSGRAGAGVPRGWGVEAKATPPGSPLPLAEFPVERCGRSWRRSRVRAPLDTASILEQNGLRPALWAALDQHWTRLAIRREAAQG